MKYREIFNESLNSESLSALRVLLLKLQNNLKISVISYIEHDYSDIFFHINILQPSEEQPICSTVAEHNFTSVFPVPFEFRARSRVSAGSEIKADPCALFLNVVLSVSKARRYVSNKARYSLRLAK